MREVRLLTVRPQRQLWIGSRARPESLRLGKGWQVRLALRPWRSKIPVPWSAQAIGRRPASETEVLIARASLPGWPDDTHEGFVLEFADGRTWTAPTGYTLVTQRLRTPQRERESRERWFG